MARIHTTIEKSLNDHGNDGVGTQLEPDILECEVKWALAKLITNNISQGGGSLMGFLELRQEPGVYSRVTTGMPILNGSLFPPHQQRDGGNLLGSPVYTQLCVWWREISLSKQFMIHLCLY